jgi:hypothetical protein
MKRVIRRALEMFRGRQSDAVLDDEIRTHLDLLAADLARRGMTPDDARAAAWREFGGVDKMKEQ